MQKRLLNRNSSVVKSRNCLARHQHESSISKLHVSLRLHRCLRPFVRFDFYIMLEARLLSEFLPFGPITRGDNGALSYSLHSMAALLWHSLDGP